MSSTARTAERISERESHGGPDAKTHPARLAAAIAGSRVAPYEGAPRGLFLTDPTRFNRDLLEFIRSVEGAALSPLMRAAIAADFCNGTSSVLDFKEWTFINGDLTLSLARELVGDWILLDAETWAGPDSIGLAAARLADRDGYFGRAVQSVLFEKR
jgi:hypothetical protein